MKPILCLVAVGEEYNKYIPSSIEKLSKKYDLCILTDRPIRLFGVLDQEIYLETIFTYFAKLTFSIRMALKHKRGVYYCDINKLHELDNLDVTDEYQFKYIREWTNGDQSAVYFSQIQDAPYWRKLVWYWLAEDYDYSSTKLIEEHAFYMPYHQQSKKLLHTIEKVKPIFEYISITNKTPYKGIGNGEGLALSYALDVCNMIK